MVEPAWGAPGAAPYYKLTLTKAQADKLDLKKRALISTGKRTLRSGSNTLSLKLGKGIKAKLHAAKIKPTLTITLGDGSKVTSA
jgi:hypothetical protein